MSCEYLTPYIFDYLPIDCEVAIRATQLPNLHRDPADRIIIATAMVHQLKIITPDQHIQAYPEIETVWKSKGSSIHMTLCSFKGSRMKCHVNT